MTTGKQSAGLDTDGQAFDDLRKSEAQYHALFSKSKVAMLLIDPHGGAIVEANDAALAFYGYGHAQITGLKISDINVLNPDEIAQEMARADAERRSHFFFRHRLSSGDVRDVEIHSGPIDVGGRHLLFSIIHDVTDRRQTETRLRRLSRRFSDVLNAATEVSIIATDCDGIISVFNSGAERMLGWDSHQVVGCHTPMLFHKSDEVEQHKAELQALYGDNLPSTFHAMCLIPTKVGQEQREWTYVRRDGRPLTVSLVVTPMRGDDGEVVGYVGIAIDISQRKRAEASLLQSEERYHDMFVDSPQPMWVYDRDIQRFLDVNQAAISHYGYRRDEFLTMTLDDIVVDRGTSAVGEQRHRIKTGQIIDVQVWTRQLPGTDEAARIALLLDVTESKRAQNAILAANNALDSQAAELKRVNAELEQFAYVASHDLRQPLRMVSSYLSLISRQLGPQLSDTHKTYLDFAVNGARRMDRLILDLLDYSRIGRVCSALEPVDLNQTMADCLINLQVAIRENVATVQVPPNLPTIQGHGGELVRLFQNLIGNALKYHRADVAPQIVITCSDLGRDWHIAVQDNGIGIAPQDQQRIFAVFQRLVSGEDYEGTGIGLAVCKKIVEHHGGRIWVQSDIGQGSTFHVTVPKHTPQGGDSP